MKKALWFGAAAIILTTIGCLAIVAAAAWQLSARLIHTGDYVSVNQATASPIPVINRQPVDAPPPPVTATAELKSASPLPLTTEQLLLQAVLPQRDQRLLAMRLKRGGQEIPQTITNIPRYSLGATDTFWITDNQSTPPRQFQVKATLKYSTDHSYWWVADGMRVNDADLQRSAERFETETYPTNRQFFGSEWNPGIDNDPHVHIFMGDVPGVAGYFSAANSYSKLAEPYSNEREMFFVNLKAISPGNDQFDSVLAHEFQHMIHWRQDKNEDAWVNEGLSELASFINGFGPSTFVPAFTAQPDTQLDSWASPTSGGDALAHYGASFMFMAYFLQRYGEELTQAVVAAPENGIEGFDTVLANHNSPERFTDIFADFLIANYLQNPALDDGKWGYQKISASPAAITEHLNSYPAERQATVYQFGADYIELTGRGNPTVEFTGSTRVPVINNQPHSGQFEWYSHRGDDTNTRLTRIFDLRQVKTATLNYWTWFDIERDWDYGYIEISTDGGHTWQILPTPHSSSQNPSGNAYGPGYTGVSGGGSDPVWLPESINLTPYAGQEVQIRFEYVTDDAVNRPGWAIDDISLPEIGFTDAAETGDNGWQAEGFVRMDNILPQKFLVQLIEMGQTVTVRRLPLDNTNHGQIAISGLGSTLNRAVLVISGLTPVTTEPASYQYAVRP